MTESKSAADAVPGQLCSLPFLGRTTVEDAVFYTVTGAVAAVGLVSWPTAGLFAGAHALHQRTRNVIREGSVREARAGLLEAVDEIA